MERFAELTIGQIFGGGISIILILSVFIEIVPVKFCPVTMFLKWLGRKINGDLADRVSDLEKKINAHTSEVNTQLKEIQDVSNERNAISCRIRILKFGDEISHGEKHSKESFDQVIADIDEYERYCNEHPLFLNNRTHVTTKKIMDVYKKCMDENDFP